MSVDPDIQEIVEYLESNDLDIVKHFKNVVQEKLYTSRDHNLLGMLTDQYIQTKSERLLDLLVGVKDAHAMYLFEKLNDHLKHAAYPEVCRLLVAIIQKQPSWLHKITRTSLFTTLLKYLKSDVDIVFIMSGIILLCELIPCVPAIIGPYHGDLLDVFVHTAGLIINKSGAIPEICILHLHTGLYIFFHRLYTMYPNNFLSYMRSCFSGTRKKDPVFQQVIKPMFEFVKFHPDLIIETPKSETAIEKWKVCQPHDVLAECQKISLDPIDVIKEANYTVFKDHTDESIHSNDISSYVGLNMFFSQGQSQFTPQKEEQFQRSDHKSIFNDQSLFCNPSEICGITTPPSSRPLTPSSSAHDITSLHAEKYSNDFRGSTKTLNDISDIVLQADFPSPTVFKPDVIKKAKSFGSIDNVSQKGKFKSWLPNNATHSTPIEKELDHHQQSAPASPRKTNTRTQQKRPASTECFKFKKDLSRQFNMRIADQFGIQSAPASPMIHISPAVQFSFSDLNDDTINTNELPHTLHKLSCHVNNSEQLVKTTSKCTPNLSRSQSPVNSVQQPSAQLIKTVQQMFVNLFPRTSSYDETNIDTTSATSRHLKSPLNLLDDFIQHGSDIHSFHLSRIPLTSQLETDWTYFGGTTPVDELKILQTQVQLLHLQLLFERHRCELHCLRNRRLFGSLQKSEALKSHDVLRDRLLLTETSLKEMKHTARIKNEEKRNIQQQANAQEKECLAKICELESKNNELCYKLKNCKMKKTELTSISLSLQKELNKTKHMLFDSTQELIAQQVKLKDLDKLDTVIDVLQKELIMQGEKQECMMNQVKDFEVKNHQHVELGNKLQAHRNELKSLQEERDMVYAHVESLKNKLNGLEACNTRKDKLIREHKNDNADLKARHKKEIQTLEDRFQSTQKTCQSLQSYITTLFGKLEESGRNLYIHQSRHSNSHSSAHSYQSIQMPPSHGLSQCDERMHKSVSYAALHELERQSSSSSRHEHSHRHAVRTSSHHSDENPFSRTKASSISDTITPQSTNEDSGIESNSYLRDAT